MSSHRSHPMPFGAQLQADGKVRFRLWAPSAGSVDVVLIDATGAEASIAAINQEGWFEVTTDRARAGSLYRYRIDGSLDVPDPASRFNPHDVAGPSEVIDPHSFEWNDSEWTGKSWHEAVIYELHVGTFTAEGTYAAAEQRLEHLRTLGVTIIELMPLAEFPGARGWGYDGVLLYAPESSYGRPDELKSFVDAAHRHGLSVLIDVVYNHFGPEGNYLNAYAKPFFTDRHHTPWGAAINFDGQGSRAVRDFFIHNTLYWLEEYHFDGLRFDAVHAICDDSEVHVLTELSQRVRSTIGAKRHVHLVLENGANEARFLGAPATAGRFDAQWSDDEHHCLHVLLTGETDGYYSDYRERTSARLVRCLTEGFAYQGEVSEHEKGKPRGEPSADLPPTAFVMFLQNHDQIGNRAFGDRLVSGVKGDDKLHAALAVLLLAPSPPMLFMGEEWGSDEPFPYFCDFHPELAQLVREGRRKEFSHFARFSDEAVWKSIPDPGALQTFESAKLRWDERQKPPHDLWLKRYQTLLGLRHRWVVPAIPRIRSAIARGHEPIEIDWQLDGGEVLRLSANLSDSAAAVTQKAAAQILYSTKTEKPGAPWSVEWSIGPA